MTDSDVYLDSSETRSPEERESDLIEQFRQHLSLAKEQSAYFAQTLKDIDPTTITKREDLSTIPVTRKSDLKTIQANTPPFGGLTTEPVGDLARVFASPGPIYEPQSSSGDFWRLKRAMYAAGVRR
ncbi:MAG: phenylacetate--CoA ligase family protein, partial [Betaproteobacteria bacterium]